MRKIGEKIKLLRRRKEKSQLELEIEAEISIGLVSRIERNIKNPTKETVAKIAKALELTEEEISYLFDIESIIRDDKERRQKKLAIKKG